MSFVSMPLAAALSASLALAPAPVGDRTARQLFDAGSLAYDRGQYLEATRAFEAAYERLPDEAIAFSLAQSHRRQYFVDRETTHLHRAIAMFELYLRRVPSGRRRADAVDQLQSLTAIVAALPADAGTDQPDDPADATELLVYASAPGALTTVDDDVARAVPAIVPVDAGTHRVRVEAPGFVPVELQAAAVEGRLVPVRADLQVQPAHLKMRTREGASIRIDGDLVGHAPLPAPVEIVPGTHELRVSAPGRVAATKSVRFDRGQTRSFDVALPSTVRRRAAWGLLGSGLGLAVVGATTLGGTLAFQRRARRIDDPRGEQNIDSAQLEELNASLDARNRLRGATIGLWSAAAVCGVVGLVLWVTDRD